MMSEPSIDHPRGCGRFRLLRVEAVLALSLGFFLAASPSGASEDETGGAGETKGIEARAPYSSDDSQGGGMEGHRPLFTTSSGVPLEEVVERITISLYERIRPEYVQFNYLTGDSVDFATNKFRLGVGAQLGEDTTMLLEVQNNSTWGDTSRFGNFDPGLIDDDDLKVYQGFFEVRNPFDLPARAKIGRQELVYGNSFLFGNAEFNNGLSHDMVKISLGEGAFSVDAFYAKLIENDVFNPAIEDVTMYGAYAILSEEEGTGLDFYWAFVESDDRAVTGFEDDRHTLGARAYAGLGALKISSEFAWQTGDTEIRGATRDQNIRAFGWENEIRIQPEDMEAAPEILVGYALATGDADPTDGDAETFIPLFQDNHPRYGRFDLVTASNVHVVSVDGSIAICPGARAGAGGYLFWAHRVQDPVAPAAFNPSGASGGSRTIGQELDVYFQMQITDAVHAELAWAHLFAGKYIRNRFGSRDDADRAYLNLVVAF